MKPHEALGTPYFQMKSLHLLHLHPKPYPLSLFPNNQGKKEFEFFYTDPKRKPKKVKALRCLKIVPGVIAWGGSVQCN